MKSKLCSNLFPAWCIGRNPHWQVIAVGNSVKFAEDNLSVLTKNIVDTDEYRLIFPEVELRKGSKAKGNWGTTKGGNFFAAGAGSAIAGRGANLTICDDVLSEQSAYSDTERTAINNWYLGGLRTRLSASGGGELIVNTRWHMDDLSAHMLKVDEESEYKWKVISIPAILDEAGAKILGKKEGESYWPEVWSLDDLHSKKATFPSSHWAALYMQNPVPDEGSIIKEEWIQYWDDDEPPAVDYVVTSMDTAYSKSEQADYTAITTWGVFFTKEIGLRGKEEVVSNLILLEAKKDKMSFGELLDECQDIKDRIDPDLFIIEKKSSGQSLIQELQLAKFPLHEYLPEKGKLERVYACETIFRAGRIYIPKGKYWTKDFVTELVHFPYAPHDDFVDSTSQAIIWMRHNLQMPHEYEIGYDSFQEEDDDVYRPKETRSYWGSL
jgi:predicted phage terminase large subunit-like protein